ncbi:DUF2167 domain-containing protein [Tabrizicola sp.]|uniref:DUF2167 domain-containing protein n=1 Tax=Tabrizicola sp. TaxID=2005166 RepID=UPI003F373A3B
MRFIRSLPLPATFCLALCLSGPALAEPFKTFFPEEYEEYDQEARSLLDQLDLQQGKITIGGGIAEINLPDNYYYINPTGASLVLEVLWGNPPEDQPSLGMIFPRDGSPTGDGWGVIVDFDPMGYVSDEDADGYNYDDLLVTMRQDTIAGNKWRQENGYQAIDLVGWAEPPHYDKVERELYWAKRLRFEGDQSDTLNYDIRELGRKGVLIASFVAGIDQLADVKAAAPDVLKMISFTDGNRYADFNPDTDQVAEMDVGGLISGNPLATAGLLAVALAFLKKGGIVLLLAPLGWLFSRFRKRGDS